MKPAVRMEQLYSPAHPYLNPAVSFHPIIETRAAWRMLRLTIHLLIGLATMRIQGPRMSSQDLAVFKQRWSLKVLKMLGVRLQAQTLDLPKRALIVSNHISLLDVFAINAVTHTHFVCKDEVRKWPCIGWFIAVTDTIFISRSSRADAARTAKILADRMLKNERVAFFPEGTTTDGSQLLPFSAALFEPASQAHASVVPMALRYLDLQGNPSKAASYEGDITFMECLRSIVKAPGLIAELTALPALPAGLGRRDYAAMTHAQISSALGFKTPAQR